MNWRNTWLLVGIAAAMFAFIWLYERHLNVDGATTAPKPLLAQEKPSATTTLEIRKGTAFVMNLERTNDAWRYTKPIRYPAATLAINAFLDALEHMMSASHITPQEIVARKQSPSEFGFDGPGTLLSFKGADGDTVSLQFGARTPGGDQVYVDYRGKPGVYVVSAAILDQLPKSQDDWRETALFPLPEQPVDRFEISRGLPAVSLALQRDTTNRLWRMKSPAHRADQLQVEDLLKRVMESRVLQFVSDAPTADLESFGLLVPEVEVTIGSGTNVQKVQFGKSPTNDPSRVFARQVPTSNIVIVARTALDLLNKDYTDQLRDRRLVAFNPDVIDNIDIGSEEPFTIHRQPNGVWTVADAPVDSAWVNAWLESVSRMEIKQVVKDVVTDFTSYGLQPPKRQVSLRTTATNTAGTTNLLVARLDFGTNPTNDLVYARRWDEYSVYAINPLDYMHVPAGAWQLRGHRIWGFSTNDVLRVAVRKGDRSRQFVRQPNGNWADTTGDANTYAIEETVFRLGQLYAVAWLARGEAAKQAYGFGNTVDQIAVDVKDGDKTRTLTVDFGGKSPLLYPYAAVTIDGQPWIFEFPWELHTDLQRYMSVPAAPGGL